MLKITHELTLQSDNSRSIFIRHLGGRYDDAKVIGDKVISFKYTSIEGTSLDGQFNDMMIEYKGSDVDIRIMHPMSSILREKLSTMLILDFSYVTFECDHHRNSDEFIILLRTKSVLKDNHDILDELNLVNVTGITVDFYDLHPARVILIKFNDLNGYNKLKLIGTIELIVEHYLFYTIIIPRSYMEYLEYTDKINCFYRGY